MDQIWNIITAEAEQNAAKEPILASFLHTTILRHKTLKDALSFHLAGKLGSSALPGMLIREVFLEAMDKEPAIGKAVCKDIVANYERDPACFQYSTSLLYYKGFHALSSYRIGHWLWMNDRKEVAGFLQNRISEIFAVDIHPAARIGSGVLIDHATGVVIGETSVVGDNVSMLHGVTLGGTGKEVGDRHPKIGNCVLIGCHAAILGNIHIGECAKIGAGSVVLQDVPAHHTAAGVPAKILGKTSEFRPALEMDHHLPEYVI